MSVRHHRGSVLTVLLAAALGLVLVMTIASTAVTGLRLSTRQSNLEQARNAAESVLAMSINELLADYRFGQQGGPGYDRRHHTCRES